MAHENFHLAIHSEPGAVCAFEKVYNTEDLVVSFYGIKFSFQGAQI